jgi:hypothetical protein
MSEPIWNVTIITGVATEQVIGTAARPTIVGRVRVGGIANLVGACVIENGATAVIETIPIGATPGTERVYEGTRFPLGLRVTPGNAGDTIIVLWKEEQ